MRNNRSQSAEKAEKTELVFKVKIFLDEIKEVRGTTRCGRMIFFHGKIDSALFKGEIVNAGVDFQLETKEHFMLSARYLLEGRDASGRSCSLLIQNEAREDADNMPRDLITKPQIITDSEQLAWLEEASLFGKIENVGKDELEILIFKK